MRFWDASAVVPLVLREAASTSVGAAYEEDPHLLVWWGTTLECVRAVRRREREGVIDASHATVALERLDVLARHWDEIQPVEDVRARARRLLYVHSLSTGDALQLAAALIACDDHPRGQGFVCLDRQLADAARREGFDVAAGP